MTDLHGISKTTSTFKSEWITAICCVLKLNLGLWKGEIKLFWLFMIGKIVLFCLFLPLFTRKCWKCLVAIVAATENGRCIFFKFSFCLLLNSCRVCDQNWKIALTFLLTVYFGVEGLAEMATESFGPLQCGTMCAFFWSLSLLFIGPGKAKMGSKMHVPLGQKCTAIVKFNFMDTLSTCLANIPPPLKIDENFEKPAETALYF